VAEQLTQTRRTATSLMLFAVVAFIYVLLTASTLSLVAQRTGITVLVVVTRANSASQPARDVKRLPAKER